MVVRMGGDDDDDDSDTEVWVWVAKGLLWPTYLHIGSGNIFCVNILFDFVNMDVLRCSLPYDSLLHLAQLRAGDSAYAAWMQPVGTEIH